MEKEIQVSSFLYGLAKEVSSRLEMAGMQGATVTLRLKKRREDAPKAKKIKISHLISLLSKPEMSGKP